jgi:hypothetical protein
MDTAEEMLLERTPAPPPPVQLVPPKPQETAPPKPQETAPTNRGLNRQERVISSAYLVMFVITVAFLAVTGLLAWLGT